MSSEEEIIIAFIYKRSGKQIISESELYLSLSMDLGWMTATEAQQFVQTIKEFKLVTEHANGLEPTFKIDTVNVPRGFTPTKKQVKEKQAMKLQEKLTDKILRRIHEQTGQPIQQLSEETAALTAEKKIIAEVAALWVARRHDCDVSDFFELIII